MAKATDKFRQTLHDCSGRDRLDFGYSGYALVVFLEYLRDRQIFDVTASEDAELAAYLSKVRHSYFLTFDPSQAARLAAKLTASELDVGDVTQFVVGFRGPEEPDHGGSCFRRRPEFYPEPCCLCIRAPSV